MTTTSTSALGGPRVLRQTAAWPAVAQYALLLTQLALATLLVWIYSIEGPTFLKVFVLASAGFAINLALPLAHRLPFFVGLSLAGAVAVFGVVDAAWMVGCGLVLIGLCHLPLSLRVRAVLLVGAGVGLAVLRAGLVASPWSSAVWPILGSMFMFRLFLYMYALNANPKDRSLAGALAYFFMLPNLAFPLFPVIDYQTFRRTYYDREAIGIYQQGMLWIARGLVHLLIYRFVYQKVLMDPIDVLRLSDLVQYMVGTFLLYLRVSGQFHLIVGVLHLFGFRLPETHKLYYLAHSFTELWRRINIYWTDFMMKAVFYPTYFRVKRLGPTRAVVVATTAVFLTTWLLHSYQWFWLRGGFPLTMPDTLFWGILGALVIFGAVRELSAVKKPRGRNVMWNWRIGLKAATTFSAFCFLWSLWSAESVVQWIWMLGAATSVDLKGVLLVVVVFGTIAILGSRNWDAAASGAFAGLTSPPARTSAALVLLLIAAQPSIQGVTPPALAEGLRSLRVTGLNARDAALQHRGYYEQLDVRAQIGNAQVLDVVNRRGEGLSEGSPDEILRDRKDVLLRDLQPSRHVAWKGNVFSTNAWGMRDKEYSQAKPAGTYRIALLGPSHVLGNGVSDGEPFENLVEERFNREHPFSQYKQVEILNFGVDGYAMPQQILMLDDRVLSFQPDLVIATHYHRGRFITERYLQKLAWSDVKEYPAELKALLSRAGLTNLQRGRIPVPFAPGRRLVSLVGVEPRMPFAESQARVRSISNDVLAWSFRHFADQTRSNGADALVLGLNIVLDDAPPVMPDMPLIRDAGLPTINLFDVFPVNERAALRVAPWDDHPNATGHRLIADALYPQLVTFIQSKLDGRTTAPSGVKRD